MSRQYLYLIQLPGDRVKIGITRNPPARLRSIDKATDGYREEIWRIVRIFRAYEYEQWLHDLFSDKIRFFRPLKGNGGTEVFRLTWLEMILLYAIHRALPVFQFFPPFMVWWLIQFSLLGIMCVIAYFALIA